MAIKKVVLNGETLIDLTMDTATSSDVVVGKTFHGRDGERYVGQYRPNVKELEVT